MCRKSDDSDDGSTWGSEIGLLEHDPVAKVLSRYELPPSAAGAQTLYRKADIADSTDVDAFKALPGVVALLDK
jgi:hypothetical protein